MAAESMGHDGTLLNLGIAFFCLVANGFYVAAEFAIVKCKPLRIEQMAAENQFAARLCKHILTVQENYLACCQLGITMASLGLGWVGEPTVAALIEPVLGNYLPEHLIHFVAFMIGFITFSSLHIVVGEQVPKIFGIRNPEITFQACAHTLWVTYILVYPLNIALKSAASSILRWMGVASSTYEDIFTGEEIKGLVDVSVEHGVMDKDQAERLQNLFAFDERTLESVMIPSAQSEVLILNGDNEKNRKIIAETQHSRFPLLGNDNKLIGTIVVKDLIDALFKGQKDPWNDLGSFSRKPMIVPETSKVKDLFERMRHERSHIAFMIDEYGSFTGLVTMEDLLEELVGEIADETDEIENEFEIINENGFWLAHGLSPLVDIQRALDNNEIDDPNANTLSGLIMNALERLPVAGDIVQAYGYKFIVEQTKDNRVEKVRIELI